jgi:hypothetical protein
MYVPKDLRLSIEQVGDKIANIEEGEFIHAKRFIEIDFAFHNQDANYDGGLSFIDRIFEKIGHFHPHWNVIEIKQEIMTADDRENVYVDRIIAMFDRPGMKEYYGL